MSAIQPRVEIGSSGLNLVYDDLVESLGTLTQPFQRKASYNLEDSALWLTDLRSHLQAWGVTIEQNCGTLDLIQGTTLGSQVEQSLEIIQQEISDWSSLAEGVEKDHLCTIARFNRDLCTENTRHAKILQALFDLKDICRPIDNFLATQYGIKDPHASKSEILILIEAWKKLNNEVGITVDGDGLPCNDQSHAQVGDRHDVRSASDIDDYRTSESSQAGYSTNTSFSTLAQSPQSVHATIASSPATKGLSAKNRFKVISSWFRSRNDGI